MVFVIPASHQTVSNARQERAQNALTQVWDEGLDQRQLDEALKKIAHELGAIRAKESSRST